MKPSKVTQKEMQLLRQCFWLLLVSFFCPAVYALEVNNGLTYRNIAEEFTYTVSEELNISNYYEYTHSSTKKLQWHNITEAIPNFGFNDRPHWFRLDLSNTSPRDLELLLVLANPPNDYIDFYLLQHDKVIDKYKTGDKYPFPTRRVDHRLPIFPMFLEAHSQYELLIRVQTEGSLQVPLELWQAQTFWSTDQKLMIGLGLYFGTLIVMVLYNLFLFVSVRDISYLFYVCFVANVVLFEASKTGIGSQFLWPNSIALPEIVLRACGILTALFICLFAMSFLRLKDNYKLGYKIFFVSTAFFSCYLVLNWFMPYGTAMSIFLICMLFGCMMCFVAGCVVWYRGHSYAKFFTLAWSGLLLGTSFGLLSRLGLIPRSFLTEHAGQIGSMIEVVLLSFALGDRINQERSEHEHAQLKAEEDKLTFEREKVEQQKLLVKRLQQLDKLKDEFLANTSHELRTPLHGIIGLTESLLDGAAGRLSNDMRESLQMIVLSGKRLGNLVNDILDFSKLKHQNLRLNCNSVDLYSIAELVIRLSKPMLGKKGVILENYIEEDLPAVYADENRLQQILYNLIGNAIKFTDEGSIAVYAEKIGDKQICIKIMDSGVGIPKEKLSSIFESFEQADGGADREFSGTGLGLAITKKLVELHHGKLQVESIEGEGSTFFFSLPIAAEGTKILRPHLDLINHADNDGEIDESPQPDTDEPPINADGAHILVVDDEPVNCQVMMNQLRVCGYNVSIVANGQEALKRLQTTGENGESKIDLILLDIMMPKMTGFDVCEEIRQHYPAQELPIIFLTANTGLSDLVVAFEVGGNDFITKPVAKEELLARVNIHLQLLEINRHLEKKIQERTENLHQKHQDLQETQKQLIQNEKMASLSTFVAGMAHEINNPCNMTYAGVYVLEQQLDSFKQFIYTLLEEGEEDEMAQVFNEKFQALLDVLFTMREGTTRVKNIVEGFRTFAYLDESEYETKPLVPEIESCIKISKANYGGQVEFELNANIDPEIHCCIDQINQTIRYILDNACDSILSKLEENNIEHETGKVTINYEVQEAGIYIEIIDTGCGMTEEEQKHMFDPFYTTKTVGDGMGLSLAITYRIIDRHGGRVEVDSTLGEGTCVCIHIPRQLPDDMLPAE